MAKLKFYKVVNIRLSSESTATVPSDEVWKGTLIAQKDTEINGVDSSYELGSNTGYTWGQGTIPNVILSGGATIKTSSASYLSFSGIAFKVVA